MKWGRKIADSFLFHLRSQIKFNRFISSSNKLLIYGKMENNKMSLIGIFIGKSNVSGVGKANTT